MPSLDFRKKTTYIIYTEDYSNIGISRNEMLDIAKKINGVIGAFPAHINDEIEVSLCSRYPIRQFMIDYKRKLDLLVEENIKEHDK